MTTDAQLGAFIARHRLLLSRESEEEIKRSSALLTNCGPKVLEQKGLALTGVGVVSVSIGLGGKTLVELERPAAYHVSPIFPPHTIRTGDLACLEENISASGPSKKALKVKGNATEASRTKSVQGVVYKVSETRIVIAIEPSESTTSDDLDLPERCRVVKLANNVTYERMDKALHQLEKAMIPPTSSSSTSPSSQSPHAPSQLARVLLGLCPPSEPFPSPTPLTFFDPNLNDSQRAAVKFALDAQEVACIHGPPGTGKTWTLVEIVRQLVNRGNRSDDSIADRPRKILICGASNLSVDNILERLLALPEKLNVTRVGHPARVMTGGVEGAKLLDATLEVRASRSDQASLAKDIKTELEAALGVLSGKGKGQKGKGLRGAERRKMWEEVKTLRKEYRQREGGVVKSVLTESQIVLATCHSSGGRQLWNQQFDVVIIDEATQALEAVCWIPILKAKKLILAGDPLQLPPTILSIANRVKEGKEKGKDKTTSGVDKKPPLGKTTKETKDPLVSLAAEPKTSSSTLPDSDGVDVSSSDEEEGSVGEAEAKMEPQASANKKDAKGKPERKLRTGLQPPRTLETTLFDRLEKMYGPGIKRILNVQYRMHETICAFPSQMLYSGKLTSHKSVASHLLRDLPETKTKAIPEEDVNDILGMPLVFFDTAGCEYFERVEGDGEDGSRCNENEAVAVARWIEQLTGAGLLPSQIAIITPYQAQVTLITSLLRPLHGPHLEIGTVDGMQGREKEAVVISLVRSNENREVGFLKEKRRLNVAMTRARRHLCIVGDSSTVRHGGPFLEKWMTWLEVNADVRYAGV